MNLRCMLAVVIGSVAGLVAAQGAAHAQEVQSVSKITRVTVYQDCALVTRAADVRLGQGEGRIVFPSIVPEFDERSLRAAFDREGIAITDVKVEREFLDTSAAERVKKLKEELEALEDRQTELEHSKQALAERKQFLDSVRLFAGEQIPEDLVTKVPSQEQLAQTLLFLKQGLADYFREFEAVHKDARALARSIDVVRKQLAEVSGGAREMTRSIVVTATAAKETAAVLSVSYLVSGASWQPVYDARADFENQEVELTLFGTIRQTTGEDWDTIQVSLSTAQPALGGRLPYVAPWFLRPVVARQDALMKSRVGGAPEAQYSAMVLEGDAAMPDEAPAPISTTSDSGIALSYTLTRPGTVKSDGAPYKFAVASQKLKAGFTYTSYPRASRLAYLGSRVANAPDQQLLPGEVNLFLSGDFVGTSGIDMVGPGEEFDLYLGADENVKVKRELVSKKADQTLIGGIQSPTRKTTFVYKLTVENYKSRAISMRLFDAMPVSEDERIKVKIVKVSPEPKIKDWEDRKGVWLWESRLEPKKKLEVEYQFTVEHPREMVVEGL